MKVLEILFALFLVFAFFFVAGLVFIGGEIGPCPQTVKLILEKSDIVLMKVTGNKLDACIVVSAPVPWGVKIMEACGKITHAGKYGVRAVWYLERRPESCYCGYWIAMIFGTKENIGKYFKFMEEKVEKLKGH